MRGQDVHSAGCRQSQKVNRLHVQLYLQSSLIREYGHAGVMFEGKSLQYRAKFAPINDANASPMVHNRSLSIKLKEKSDE